MAGHFNAHFHMFFRAQRGTLLPSPPASVGHRKNVHRVLPFSITPPGDEHQGEVITPPIVRAPQSIKHRGLCQEWAPSFCAALSPVASSPRLQSKVTQAEAVYFVLGRRVHVCTYTHRDTHRENCALALAQSCCAFNIRDLAVSFSFSSIQYGS